MDRAYTGKQQNTLHVAFENPSQYKLKVVFPATVQVLSGQPNTIIDALAENDFEVTYDQEAAYSLTVTIYHKNQVAFIEENLHWEYSTLKPVKPIVSFSQEATPDVNATMVFGANVDTKTNEFWIEGDLASQPEGAWYPFPTNLTYKLMTSADDGMKNFTVKYRNIYGNESVPVQVQIEKKSVGPTACQVLLPGTGTATQNIRVQLSATNDGIMKWLVNGDIATKDANVWGSFTDSNDFDIQLTSGTGTKTLVFQMQDLAANKCPNLPITEKIVFDPNGYVPSWITMDQNALWVPDQTAVVHPHFDHLPGDNIQMWFEGSLVNDGNYGVWLPYADPWTVTLSPITGLRDIKVKFNDIARGKITDLVMTTVFLNPTIYYQSGTIFISDMPTLASATITGCTQSYSQVQFVQLGYACTLTGTTVTVVYSLEDGSTITRTVTP